MAVVMLPADGRTSFDPGAPYPLIVAQGTTVEDAQVAELYSRARLAGVALTTSPLIPAGDRPATLADLSGYLRNDGTVPTTRRVTQADMAASADVPALGVIVTDDAGNTFVGDAKLSLRDMPPNLIQAPPPRGPGLDDTANILALAAWAAANNKSGIALRACPGSAPYRFTSQEISFPDGVILWGPGDNRCAIVCNGAGALRFGVLVGPNARTYTGVGGWRINANNSGTSVLRIGYCTASSFEDIRVTNTRIEGPSIVVQTTQNTLFTNMEAAQNGGDGWWFDMGCANLTIMHTIVRDNGLRGVVFTMSADTPAGTASANSPRNIRWIGGLIESNNGPNVCIESGGQIDFISAQTSHSAGITTPTFLISDAKPTRPVGPVKFWGGQLKAGSASSPTGACVRVLRGSLAISDGVVVTGGEYAFETNDSSGSRITYTADTIFSNNTNFSRVIAMDPASGSNPTGTGAVAPAVYDGAGTATTVGSPTYSARSMIHAPGSCDLAPTADVGLPDTALVTLPWTRVNLKAGQEARGTITLVTRGDPNADLKLALAFSGGNAGIRWWSVALPAATTTSTGQVTRDLITGGGAGPRVGIIATDTVVSLEYVVMPPADGDLTVTAAQFASVAGTPTLVTGDSRMHVRGGGL